MLRLPIILLLAAMAACEAERDHRPALQAPAAAVEEVPVPVRDAPLLELPSRGLELIDTETGLTAIDIGPLDEVSGVSPPKFALHCHTADKKLEIAAPARQLGAYAVAGPAAFVASGRSFAGEAVLAAGEATEMRMALPLTPDLIAAVATTYSVRLVIGDGFAESNTDINGVFPGFAGQCSLQSGVPLPPR